MLQAQTRSDAIKRLKALEPETPLLIYDIVNRPVIKTRKKNDAPLLPISKTAFLNGVMQGVYPKPFKIGSNMNAWRAHEFLQALAGGGVTT